MSQDKSYYQRLFSLVCTYRRIAADQVKEARKYAREGEAGAEAYFIAKAHETRREARSWIAYARRFQPAKLCAQDEGIAA